MHRRIAIGIAYNGANWHGWQRQRSPEVLTVQGELERALSQIAAHPVRSYCAGRTDARVHAPGQVAHFDVAVERDSKAWIDGVNSVLPKSIRVQWAKQVDSSFHARYSATARRYEYWIHNAAVASALFDRLLTHVPRTLDVALMQAEAQCLLGELDFTSFRATACDSRTAMRNVHHLRVTRDGERICVDIQANAFLLHMVRNIVGSLLEVGSGRQPAGWLAGLLEARDRRLAAATASPAGLYLCNVRYPKQYGLPLAGYSPFAGAQAESG
ncbi:MAG: tRNA pseudouridine(38-40) synthase TruA [Gammaproteobacteria bacterium]|nr:tRNA pseudouridine(38-40) synthase TruA [Gammaproteobacteria bacterium]MBT8152043.1 tRNA pseudouridine(38-40) synthase TruA [Gammaproteobacteria bacterium]NND38044.1 tRNA pseudouridine(38-40) synthase TruA [Pseudomonadales bacterium]NNL11480.1 tRNA pseudouridine(38-40) synthase TruA [Pseudomonadales bacterium]NNM10641.1 tRNA pseudouridine(38-40) synthase TruA [Pseudomonadales bacterium]